MEVENLVAQREMSAVPVQNQARTTTNNAAESNNVTNAACASNDTSPNPNTSEQAIVDEQTKQSEPLVRHNDDHHLITGNMLDLLSNDKDTNEDSIFDDRDWLCTVQPVTAYYFPQPGDDVVYVQEYHKTFFKYVHSMNLYDTHESDMPWTKSNLKAYEFAKVAKVSYEMKNHTRICCLRLERTKEAGEKTGEYFDVEYHYIKNRRHDFLVLRQHFDMVLVKNWQVGNRCRVVIGNDWYSARILAVQAQDPQEFPDAKFDCLRIQTDNGSEHNVNPWNVERINEKEQKGIPVLVTAEDLRKLRYQPKPNEWHQDGRPAVCRRILRDLDRIAKTQAESFAEITKNPLRAFDAEYPIDLWTIKARLKNFFYRRVDALKLDIRYFAKNFEAQRIADELFKSIENATTIEIVNIDTFGYETEKSDFTHSVDKEQKIESVSETGECSKVPLSTSTPITFASNSDESAINNDHIDAMINDGNAQDSLSENKDDSGVDNEKNRKNKKNRKSNVDASKNNKNKLSVKTKKPSICSPKKNLKERKKTWFELCKRILNLLCKDEDSAAFRQPVDEDEFPDYRKCVSSLMDLQTVREELMVGNYSSQIEFAKDIWLIFKNSKSYYTDQESDMYRRTERLSAKFTDLMIKYFRKSSNNEVTKKNSLKKIRLDNNCSNSFSKQRKRQTGSDFIY